MRACCVSNLPESHIAMTSVFVPSGSLSAYEEPWLNFVSCRRNEGESQNGTDVSRGIGGRCVQGDRGEVCVGG